MRLLATATALVVAALTSACGHDHSGGPGTLTLTVSGEPFVEDGIPASEFSDGWAVTFDSFLVSIGDVKVGHGHGDTRIYFEDAGFRVFDLAKSSNGSGFAVTSVELAGGHYDHYQYRVAPTTAAGNGNAERGDFDAFIAAGYAVWVEGSATDGSVTKQFDWGFPTGTLYNHCHAEADIDGEGVTVDMTIRAEHLFYDGLFASRPTLAFQLIADADDDGDGAVSMDELAAIDITRLSNYDTGTLVIANLRDYIDQAAGMMGFLDGDGICGEQARQ